MNIIAYYKERIKKESKKNINNYFSKILNKKIVLYAQKELYISLKELLNLDDLKAEIIFIEDMDYDVKDKFSSYLACVFVDNFLYKTKLFQFLQEKYNNNIYLMYQDLFLDIGLLEPVESKKLWKNIEKLTPFIEGANIQKIISNKHTSYVSLFKDTLLSAGVLQDETMSAFIYTDVYSDTFGNLMDKVSNTIIFSDSKNDSLKSNCFYGTKYLKFITFIDIYIGTYFKELPQDSRYINIHHGIIDDPAIAIHRGDIHCYIQSKIKVANLNIVSSKLLETKNQICLGYPKLDKFIDYYAEHKKSTFDIVIATSNIIWNFEKLSPVVQDKEFIFHLLTNFADNRVIFRPHPAIKTNPYILEYVSELQKYTNFHFDTDKSYLDNFSKAQVFIADGLSSSAYTYAFATLKPVIFYIPKFKEYVKDYKNKKYTSHLETIGDIAKTKEELSALVIKYQKDTDYIKNKAIEIKNLRDENIINIGNSEEKIIEFLNIYKAYSTNDKIKKHYSERVISNSIKKINDYFDSFKNKKIAIYGAGDHFSTVMKKIYDFSKLDIVCFSDSNKALVGKTVENVKVVDKDSLSEVDAILISSKNYEAEIFMDLSEKYDNVCQLYKKHKFDIMMILEKNQSNAWLNIEKMEYFLDEDSINQVISKDCKTYIELFDTCFSLLINKKEIKFTNDLNSFYSCEDIYLLTD